MFPRKAAKVNISSNDMMSSDPDAAKAPVARSNESPGRKGVTTKAVSLKMTI